MKMVKIKPKGESVWLIQTPEEIKNMIMDATHDEGKYDIEIINMTKQQLEKLDEFVGW